MTEIIYDSYDGINADPDIVFGDLKFELKRFDFDKDIIFKNMTQIKKKKEDMTENEMWENVFNIQSYEFNYDNVLEKLRVFYPDGIIKISDTMFIQLYLYLITNKTKKFIFKRKAFESIDSPPHQTTSQKYLDNNKSLLFIMYYENYHVNDLLKKVKCPYTHLHLLKTGIHQNGFEVYSGITAEGIIYTKNVMDWAKYIRQQCKVWLEENKKTSTIEYENFSKIEKEKDNQIVCYPLNGLKNIENEDMQELMKGVELYSKKKYIDVSYNYFDIGYFDILEFSNCEIKIAINVVKEIIVDIKN